MFDNRSWRIKNGYNIIGATSMSILDPFHNTINNNDIYATNIIPWDG